MNSALLASIAGATVVAAGVVGTFAYFKLRNKIKIKYVTEQIESELQFVDVVSYLKTLNLDNKKHTPFIANCNKEDVKIKLNGFIPDPKEGYSLLFIGVYDKNNDIVNGKFIYSLGWSEKLSEALGNEGLVVLG